MTNTPTKQCFKCFITQQIKGLTQAMVPLEIQKDMAKRAFAFPDEFEWTQQGLGMVRAKLTRSLRLHIWHPNFIVKEASRIHNHPWHFTSNILAGFLTNVKYSFTYDASQMLVHTIECGANVHVKDTYVARIGVDQIVTYKKGDLYSMRKTEFHNTVIGDRGCISIIERDLDSWENDDADVVTNMDKPFVNARPEKLAEKRVRQILLMPDIKNLIKEMNQR